MAHRICLHRFAVSAGMSSAERASAVALSCWLLKELLALFHEGIRRAPASLTKESRSDQRQDHSGAGLAVAVTVCR